jgi:hypothetical protein
VRTRTCASKLVTGAGVCGSSPLVGSPFCCDLQEKRKSAGLLVLGILVFGIATARAGVQPRWVGVLQIASFLVFMAFLFVPPEVTRR